MQTITVTFTVEEYEEYRRLQKKNDELETAIKARDEMIKDVRDQYVNEFKSKMDYKQKVEKIEHLLNDIRNTINSQMPEDLKLKTIMYKLNENKGDEQ